MKALPADVVSTMIATFAEPVEPRQVEGLAGICVPPCGTT